MHIYLKLNLIFKIVTIKSFNFLNKNWLDLSKYKNINVKIYHTFRFGGDSQKFRQTYLLILEQLKTINK